MSATLRKGMRGEAIKRLQRVIGARVDGIFGRETEQALRRWQAAHKLVADGIAGAKTIAKMGRQFLIPVRGGTANRLSDLTTCPYGQAIRKLSQPVLT